MKSDNGTTTAHADLPEVWTAYDYTFTEAEKKALSEDLALAVTTLDEVEEEKKAVVSGYKARIDSLKSEIKDISHKLTKGGERRKCNARVQKDYDAQTKTFFDIETGEVIKTEPFSYEDLQRSFDES